MFDTCVEKNEGPTGNLDKSERETTDASPDVNSCMKSSNNRLVAQHT